MIQFYCVLNDSAARHNHINHKYILVPSTYVDSSYNTRNWYQLFNLCDYIIQSDCDGYRYVKNRSTGNNADPIDPEWLTWVILSSVDIEQI